MENASKALLIAGGVLIAILIVSVLVVTLNIVNSNQRTREKALVTEQLAEFNQKYEAYNKKALRGTDIITLMKMAIENNNSASSDNPYYINVIIDLGNKKIQDTSTRTVVLDKDKKVISDKTKRDPNSLEGTSKIILGTWIDNVHYKTNGKVEKFFTTTDFTDSMEEQTESNGNTTITYKYSSFTTFKNDIFQCTNVEYNNQGRIKELEFKLRS
jgi:hypothetical protein